MAENTAKKFRLSFVNAAEDVPRLVRAYGKACQGEFAMVLRPPDQRGLLVLVRKEGAAYWRTYDSTADAPQVPEMSVSAKDAVRMIQVEQKAIRVAGPITLRGTWSGWLHCDAGTPRVELERKLAQYGILRIVSGADGWTWTVERTEKWFSKAGSDTGVAASLLKAIEGGLARAMGLLGEACSVRDTRRRAALDTSFATEHPITPAREAKDPTERLKVKEPRKTRAGTPPAVDAPAPVPDAPATPSAMRRMAEEAAAEADALAAIRDVPWVWMESSAKDDAVDWFNKNGMEDLAEQILGFQGGPDRPVDAFLQMLREQLDELNPVAETKAHALTVLKHLADGWKLAPALLERARRLIRYAATMSGAPMCRGKEQKESVAAVEKALSAYTEARDAIARGEPVDGVRKLRSIAQWAAIAAAKAGRSCAAGQTSLTAGVGRVDTLQPGDRAALVKEPRRVGTVVELRDAENVVWREDGQSPRMVAASRLKAVEADSGLVVVPMGRVPTTPAELLATMTGHTSTFAGSPTPGNAKKWVKAALMHVGVEGASLSARTVDDGSGTRVAVRIVLPPASVGGAEVERKLRIVDSALGKKGAPRIGLEGWSYGGEEVRTARAPSAAVEPEVDAAKDKALIDAFSAAVAVAMQQHP
jgi:hypothetical protein